MKKFFVWIMGAVLMSAIGVVNVAADEQQTTAPAEFADLSTKDTVAALEIVSTYIRNYGPSAEQLTLFDLAAGQQVDLALSALHPEKTLKVSTNIIGVCATFISPEEKNYTVWFVVQKGIKSNQIIKGFSQEIYSPNTMKVQDVVIHEVDGQKQVEWVQNDDDTWEARQLKNTSAPPPVTPQTPPAPQPAE